MWVKMWITQMFVHRVIPRSSARVARFSSKIRSRTAMFVAARTNEQHRTEMWIMHTSMWKTRFALGGSVCGGGGVESEACFCGGRRQPTRRMRCRLMVNRVV